MYDDDADWDGEESDGFSGDGQIESTDTTSSLEEDGYLGERIEQIRNELAEDPDNEDLLDELHRIERSL
jgi:hypothetical protein